MPFCSSRFTFYSCSFKFVAHKHSTKSASYRSICNFTFSPNNRRYCSRVCPGFGLLSFFCRELVGLLQCIEYKTVQTQLFHPKTDNLFYLEKSFYLKNSVWNSFWPPNGSWLSFHLTLGIPFRNPREFNVWILRPELFSPLTIGQKLSIFDRPKSWFLSAIIVPTPEIATTNKTISVDKQQLIM